MYLQQHCLYHKYLWEHQGKVDWPLVWLSCRLYPGDPGEQPGRWCGSGWCSSVDTWRMIFHWHRRPRLSAPTTLLQSNTQLWLVHDWILIYDWSKFTQRLNQWLLDDTLELIQRIYLLNTFIIGLGCTRSSWRRSVFLTPDNTNYTYYSSQ